MTKARENELISKKCKKNQIEEEYIIPARRIYLKKNERNRKKMEVIVKKADKLQNSNIRFNKR